MTGDSGSQGPWGNRGSGGNSPWGSAGQSDQQPPNIEDIFKKGRQQFDKNIPSFPGGAMGFVILVVAALWALTGFYRVLPNEQGVVLRFGEYVYTTAPGLHYHLPFPIETAATPNVTKENREELGFRTTTARYGQEESTRDISEESLMLTGDENIIDIDFTVTWNVKDAGHYLFNIRNPETTVRVAAESAMREVIGQTPIQLALTEGRRDVEDKTQETLQSLLDQYEAGINIKRVQLLRVDPPKQVVDAFNDVQRAKADRERLRNEAEAYRNDIIPKARGEAEQKVQEAEAYKAAIVTRAKGDAERFTKIQGAYKKAKKVTARRLYLETMEGVLKDADKIVIDPKASGNGVLPYLPLPALKGEK